MNFSNFWFKKIFVCNLNKTKNGIDWSKAKRRITNDREKEGKKKECEREEEREREKEKDCEINLVEVKLIK